MYVVYRGDFMEFKKCVRCGCFFMSDSDVCMNCEPKDRQEINKLNNFIEENDKINNIQDLSINTSVSINNINRYIQNKSLNSFKA